MNPPGQPRADGPPTTPEVQQRTDLALFPLGTVLFPGGLLSLRIFEARYLDLISHCLRSGDSFGVVTLIQGAEVRNSGAAVRFEAQGCLAELLDCDAQQAGRLHIRCRGMQRFELRQPRLEANGLWRADATLQPADAPLAPPTEFLGTVRALHNAITALQAQGQSPLLPPYQLTDAGWVANRWAELLPIPLQTKLGLMVLSDPVARLRLIDHFLRRQAIISD